MLKFSAHLSMLFEDLDFLARFQAAADTGFKAVDLKSTEGHSAYIVRQKLEEANLKLLSIDFAGNETSNASSGIGILPGREEDFRRVVERVLESARILGCKMVLNLAGVVPKDTCRELCLDTYIKNLRWAAARMAEGGIRLLIEPINTNSVPGYILPRAEDALEVIHKTDSDNLFLCYDLYHAHMANENVPKVLRTNIKRIAHVHIAGVPLRNEPDVGTVDYSSLFSLLDEIGYGGWVCAEYHPHSETIDGLGWAKNSLA